jgi:hypothetical protein
MDVEYSNFASHLTYTLVCGLEIPLMTDDTIIYRPYWFLKMAFKIAIKLYICAQIVCVINSYGQRVLLSHLPTDTCLGLLIDGILNDL